MNNQDYNEPMRDYCSPEEENRYDRPLYETAAEYNSANANNSGYSYESTPYGNSNYYGNNNYYGNSYYGNGGYTNVGGTIIDTDGKPLKNHFGVQLTFSIIEMLCCCASCITLIMGIISCIFTCSANTCYKQGRYDEYKSKSKTSTILLIIGGVFAAISILWNGLSLVVNWDTFVDEFMYEFEKELENELGYDVNMDTFWEDYMNGEYFDDYDEYEDDYYSEYNENADHENFEDFNEIIVDGVSITLPCTYADLEAAGFFMNRTDLNTEIGSCEATVFELHTTEKALIAEVQFVNLGDEACKAEDATVIYLSFYYEGEEEKEIFDGYEFVNGLSMFSNVEETLQLLGEPNEIYKEDYDYEDYGYEYYEWYCWNYEYVDGYYSYVSISFYDDVIYSIQINNGPEGY